MPKTAETPLAAAEAVLALVNSQPRAPSREQIAAVIAPHLATPAVGLSPEGERFRIAVAWEMDITRRSIGRALDREELEEANWAADAVERAARAIWARPAAGWADVAARALVAALRRWEPWTDTRWEGEDGRVLCGYYHAHPRLGQGVAELLEAIEAVSGGAALNLTPHRHPGAQPPAPARHRLADAMYRYHRQPPGFAEEIEDVL